MSHPQEPMRAAMRLLYADHSFIPRAWTDSSDPAFPCIHLIERSIACLAPRLSGDLLDVGCGRQPYRAYFKNARSIRACDWDGKRGAVDFECPADKVPLPDASLDAILNTEVLEHVPDPLVVWREFARLLRPGGKLLLTTPMYWPGHEEPHDYHRFTEFGLRRLAEQSGFEIANLLPRGGSWAFLAQSVQHVIPQYLRFRWQRRLVNRLLLRLDAWRCNPNVTLGWTLLAVKKSAPSV